MYNTISSVQIWFNVTELLLSRHKAIYKYNFCNIVLDPKYIITLKGRICHVLILIFLFGVHGVSWRECIGGPITYFVTVHVARCSTGIDYDYILQSHYLSSSFSLSTSALFLSTKLFSSSTWSQWLNHAGWNDNQSERLIIFLWGSSK